MAITLPQAIFAYQVRKTAQDLGAIGTVAGIAFTYFQTRRPKLALAVGAGMIGYFLYQSWLREKRAEKEFGSQAEPTTSEPAPGASPEQDAHPALV